MTPTQYSEIALLGSEPKKVFLHTTTYAHFLPLLAQLWVHAQLKEFYILQKYS